MIAMMDVDRSGKLGLEEFKILWTDVRNWRVSFFYLCCPSATNQISSIKIHTIFI
jgi:hypothetical protein